MARQLKFWVYIGIGLIAVIVLFCVPFFVGPIEEEDHLRGKALSAMKSYKTAFEVYSLYDTQQSINLKDLYNNSNCNAQMTKELMRRGCLELGSNEISLKGSYLDPWGNPYNIELKERIPSDVSNIVFTGAYDLVIWSSNVLDHGKVVKMVTDFEEYRE